MHRAARPPLQAAIYILALFGATAAVAAAFFPHLGTDDPWGEWFLFAALAIGAGFVRVQFTQKMTTNAQSGAMVAAALVLPPELVLLLAAVTLSGLSPETFRNPWKLAFNLASFALSGAAAWAVADALLDGTDFGLVVAGIAATTTYVVVNQLSVALVLRLAEDVPLRRFPLFTVECEIAAVGAASLGIAVAGLWETAPWLLVTLAAPIALAVRALRVPLLRDEMRLEEKTGLYNSRYFGDALKHEVARASRFERPFAVLMVDLDYLREVNNTYGHLVGDDVIVGVAKIMRAQIRSVDIASRFGGEEFAILLPETHRAQAREVAQRIRAAVAGAEFGPGVKATVSIGVAGYPAVASTADDLLGAADRALYEAKAAGRNIVVVAEPPAPAVAVA